MYLVYLGESGNTGASTNDPNQMHHVHAGVLVHETQWVPMNGEFNALYRRYFGGPPGEVAAPRQIRAADVYHGRDFYSSWQPSKRAELLQDCLSIMIRRETPVLIAYLDKRDYAQARDNGGHGSLWSSPSEPIMGRFLFALNMFMDELGMSTLSHEEMMQSVWPIKDYTLVVADKGKSVKQAFLDQFIQSESDLPTPAILEDFCYTETEQSVFTQLANMCAYFVRRWLQDPSSPHSYFEALQEGKVIQVIYPVKL